MREFVTLTRRELGSFFVSFSGYVIIAAAAFLMGLSFVVLLVKLRSEPLPMPVTEMFYLTPFFWTILLLAVPVITMRLFALEKYSGTFETLMTTPVTEFQVVTAKFTGAMMFYMILWLPLLACLLVIRYYSGSEAGMDVGSVGGTFLGIFLMGCLFISMGCFASSLTHSQMVAAMVSLATGFSLFLLSVLADRLPTAIPWQADVAASLGLFEQMHDFSRGVVDTRPIVFCLSLAFFFLFLTLRAVESRRWK
jgi:ABC-2 type transport system permease protein